MKLSLLYRGPLSSCNYGCAYCPFAKRRHTRAELAEDEAALHRFVAYLLRCQDDQVSVLFTPWGEALVHRWYRDALATLSQQAHVRRVAIQTNLACRMAWLDHCDPEKVALWATFHPTEISAARFLARVHAVHARGVRLSVGVVGLPEHLAAAQALRAALPEDVYLWVNAAKRVHGAYAPRLRDAFTAIDPLFPINTRHHESRGHACHTGDTVFSVDGTGDVRRCHFVSTRLGNLYDDSFRAVAGPEPCPNDTCGCHIGYVHLERLGLSRVFGDGVLERVPPGPPWPKALKPPRRAGRHRLPLATQ